MEELLKWTPPSVQKMEKLPRIDIPSPAAVAAYRDWFAAHPEIPRTVPPIYREFRLTYSLEFPNRDGTATTNHYTECVHYAEDLTAFACCHIIDGRKMFVVVLKYADIDGVTVHANLLAPERSNQSVDWLNSEGCAAAIFTLAVQAFLLYHRPEVIPKILPEPACKAKPSTGKPKTDPKTRVVGDSVTRYIRLDGDIPKTRRVTYRAIQWQVRGHYRHTTHGGKPAVIYIKPHMAKRGEKKQKPATTILAATPKTPKKENQP